MAEVGREDAKEVAVGLKRGLLHFDISELPPQAIVTGATLRLFIAWKYLPMQDPTDLSITVSRLSADFVEGDGTNGVTWNTQPGVEASPTDTEIMDALVGDWFEMDITAVTLAEWQSADPTNVLIRIGPTEETPALNKYFGYRTKEFETGEYAPQLVIDYDLPTPTPTNTPTVTPTNTATPTPTPDVEPPVITITSPADGSRLGGATVLVTGTVSDGSPITSLTVNGISITPASFFSELVSLNSGMNTITVEAIDSFSNMGSEQIAVTRNQPPALGAVGNQTVQLGDQLTLTLTATDPDAGDTLSFLVTPLPLPAGASLNAMTGVFSFAPTINDAGKVLSFTFLVSDGVSTDEETIQVTVGTWPTTGMTALTGVILDAHDASLGITTPVQGVTIRQLDGSGAQTTSASDGSFTLSTNLIPGKHTIEYDPSTVVGQEYGGYRAEVELTPNITTILQRPIYLPHIDADGKATVMSGTPTVVHNPNIGVTLVIPADAVEDENGMPYTGVISVSEVPADFTPGALPDEFEPGLVITVQPMGLTFDVPAAVTYPNIDNMGPGNGLTLWSLDHGLGIFVAAGEGEVSGDGLTIETTQGGILEASWHFAAAPSPGSESSSNSDDSPPTDSSCGGCKDKCDCGSSGGSGPGASSSSDFGSSVLLPSGRLGTGFSLPAYNSLSEARSLEFLYSSITANPEYVLPFDAVILAFGGVPDTLSYQLEVAGVAQGTETFVDTSALFEDADETIRAALRFDATDLPTGLYPVTVRLTNNYPMSRFSSEFTQQLIHVDDRDSPFGVGWTLRGLDRIYERENGDVVLVEGGQAASHFITQTPQLYEDLILAADPIAYFRLGESQLTGGACQNGRDEVSEQSVSYRSASVPDWHCGVPGAIANDGNTAVYVAGTGGDLAFRNLDVEDLPQATDLRFAGAEEFTLEIWTRFTKHELVVGLMGAWQNNQQSSSQYQLAIRNDGKPSCRILRHGQPSPDDITGPTNLNDDAWHHIVCRYHSTAIGGDGLTLFVDGQEVASAPTLSGPVNQNGDRPPELRCTRGSLCGIDNCLSPPCGSQCLPFSGYEDCESGKFLDEGAWYDHALTDDTILAHYEAGAFGVFAPAVLPHVSPPGEFSTLFQNADGTFTRTLKDGTKVHFDADGFQTAIEDRNGNMTTYEYNGSGQLFRITDPVGLETTLQYSGDHLSSVTDPANRVTMFEHDPAGNLVRVIFPDDSTRSFGYDGRHLMTAETDGRLLTTEREYNWVGSAIRATLPDGSERETTAANVVGLIDPSSGLGTEMNPAPVKRPDDAISTLTDGEGRSWEIESGVMGLATSITDRADLVTNYERDSDGNPTRIVYPSGHAEMRTYDEKGNVETLTDETLGGTTTFEYDPVSSGVSKIIDPHMEETIILYTPEGNPYQITTPEQRVTTITYDVQGRPERITDVLGTVTKFTYDPTSGNLISVLRGENLDPSIQRLIEMTSTSEGYIDEFTDAQGRHIDFDYDPMGRVTLQTLPGNLVVDFDYDPNGNLTGLTPPGKPLHSFDYNGLNLEELYTPPQPDPPIQNPTTITIYNDAQQLEMLIRPGGDTISYGYDPEARLETITHSPSGDLYTYIYQPTTGLLDEIEGQTGINLELDYLGELLTSETWSGAVSGSVSRTYEETGRVETETVTGGETVAFDYDNDGLVTSATSTSATFTINRTQTTGLIHDTILGAITDTWDYNEFGELESYEAEDGVDSLYSVQYQRDRLGRIVEKGEIVGGVTTIRKYEYDPAGRLERVLDGNDVQLSRYVYDDNGNRLEHRGMGDTLIASGDYDDQDRLKEYGGAEYVYGPNGELKSNTENGETTTYEYDALGNLRTVVLPTNPSMTIEYLVDGRNRRVGKKVDGLLVQRLFYKDQLNPVAWIDGQGSLAQFVYGTRTNVPDYMIRSGIVYRIVSDQLGSVRLVINDATGNVAQRIDYDEFGNATLVAGSWDVQPFGFAGGIYDEVTELLRYGTRDFDTRTGRWTAKDRIGFAGGDSNLYGYVMNDPINAVDSSGLLSDNAGCRLTCGILGAGLLLLCPVEGPLLPLCAMTCIAIVNDCGNRCDENYPDRTDPRPPPPIPPELWRPTPTIGAR